MGLIGQVSLARAGTALELEFDVEDLKDVIENQARPYGHVTLHPGNFSELDEEIEIPEGVAVTILPGADVEYIDNFRNPGCPDNCVTFDHDGSPNDSTVDHPLSNDFKRYERPEFTGHVENIADLNLASEWALETTPQVWTAARAGTNAEIDVLAGDADEDLRTLSFRGGAGAEVAVEEDTREIEVSLDPKDFVRSANFNRLLLEENNNSVGDINVSHEAIETDYNTGNSDENDPSNGARLVRSILIHESEPPNSQTTAPDGHVQTINEANLTGTDGVNINVTETTDAPDEIEISAGGVDTGVNEITAGTDISVSQNTGSVEVSHGATGGAGNSANSGGTVIQTFESDGRGHAENVATVDLDDRYVQESGDTMSGALGFDVGTSVDSIRTDVRSAGNEDDNTLVTEAGIRDAIDIASGNTFVDDATWDTSTEQLTLTDNSGDTRATVNILTSNIHYDVDDSVAVSNPDNETIRFSSSLTAGTPTTIADLRGSSSFSTSGDVPGVPATSFDSEFVIDGEDFAFFQDSNVGTLAMGVDKQLAPNVAMLMNPDDSGNVVFQASTNITMGFDTFNEAGSGNNGTSGLAIESEDSLVNFSQSGARVIISNAGYIDIPTRDQGEVDPPDPPEGFIRVFARAEDSTGNAGEVVFLEASGNGAVIDP